MHIILTANAAWNILNFRRPIVKRLLENGHQVTVLAPRDDAVKSLEAMGCRFVALQMDVKGLSPLKDFKLILELRRILKKEMPDAILSYTIKNNIFGAIASRRLNIPFIPNVTGLGTAFLSGSFLQSIAQTLYKYAFSRLDTVFFQNVDDRNLFIERKLLSKQQTQLLPGSGIDVGRFSVADLPNKSNLPVFLLIARLIKDKGIFEFVEAAQIVHKTVPKARFQILGAIGSKNRGAIDLAVVKSWQRDGFIEYLGETSDVRPFIAKADCVVLPSYREGAPRTLIEACAMARPIVTTDVPGCRSVVDDERTGYLCDVRSGKNLAAACLKIAAQTPEERTAMGQAGRLKIETEFNQNIIIDAYEQALHRMEVDV